MSEAERIVAEALNLSEEDRTDVAMRLLDSIEAPDPHAPMTNEEFEAMLLRRADELASGKVKGVPWSQIRAEIEERLGR